MKRLLFLYNPKSGDGRIRSSLAEIVEIMSHQGFEVTVYPTLAAGDGMNYIVENGPSFQLIVVAGGDGMLHEAVNGLAKIGFSRRLGYIPSGTVNDFANTHEIPWKMDQAALAAVSNSIRQIDLGLFNDEYFAYVAACGVMTHVSYDTSQADKKRFRSLAYLVNALTNVDYSHWENNCVSMNISWEGGHTSGDFLFCAVSNSRYIAGSDQFANGSFHWDDALLEGFFIRRPMNLLDLNLILGSIMRKDYTGEYFVQVQSPWFSIHGEPAKWTLDGEYGGCHRNVYIRVVEQALLLSMPEEVK